MKDCAARAPASLLSIVMGLTGLGSAWRLAHEVWHLPSAVGEVILTAATAIWLTLLLMYGIKWLLDRDEALRELKHPVQSCFVAFVPLSTILIAATMQPYLGEAAFGLFLTGAGASLCYALYHVGRLSLGGQDPAAVTPALVLPSVGCCFISAIGAGAFGYPDWGRLAFGAGIPFWVAIEVAVRFRLYILPEMPPPLRPTLGIILAPPTVGAVAYLNVTIGLPDHVAELLVGYGLLQALMLLRLLPWIGARRFNVAWWAFSFGVSALAAAPLRFMERGGTGPIATLAPILFVFANLVIGALAVGTLLVLAKGRFLPAAGTISPDRG